MTTPIALPPGPEDEDGDELARTRRRLRHASQLAGLGQLAAGVAHEIRNPLNFVTNFAEIGRESLAELRTLLEPLRAGLTEVDGSALDGLLEDLHEDLATILRHGQRAARIVEQMLGHARGEDGPPHHVALNELVENAQQLAFHGARAADPQLRVSIHCDLDPEVGTVLAAPQCLTRALINLMDNGLQAAMARARREGEGFQPMLWLTTARQSQALVVRIRDNGEGMTAAVRGRLGEPFFTTKPPGSGSGLGFALSREIIQRHRGSLTVDSTPGAHTEITVHLPHPIQRN